MKSKLLMVLLILSLGFNIGFMATFGHHWLMKKEFANCPKENSWHKAKVKKMLNLTDEQVQVMEKDRKELQYVINPIREELKNKRTELFNLLDTDNIDKAKLEKLIAEISSLQMAIEKNVIEHSINIRKNLTPEQQKKFKTFLKKGFEKMAHGPRIIQEEQSKNIKIK